MQENGVVEKLPLLDVQAVRAGDGPPLQVSQQLHRQQELFPVFSALIYRKRTLCDQHWHRRVGVHQELPRGKNPLAVIQQMGRARLDNSVFGELDNRPNSAMVPLLHQLLQANDHCRVFVQGHHQQRPVI